LLETEEEVDVDGTISKGSGPMRSSGDPSSLSAFPLALAGEGNKVKIVSLRGGKGFQERLISMGLNIGDEIEVILCRERGPILVAKEGMRYGLGGGMAQKIFVVMIEGRRYED
jgi:Fe2+ transport system protein FeoA